MAVITDLSQEFRVQNVCDLISHLDTTSDDPNTFMSFFPPLPVRTIVSHLYRWGNKMLQSVSDLLMMAQLPEILGGCLRRTHYCSGPREMSSSC